jgi:hypothetical protein
VTGKLIELVAAEAGAPAPGFATPGASVISTAVADLTGHPPTSLRAFFEANKDKLLAS